MQTSRAWVKLPISILDDPRWGRLPDDQWLKKFYDYIHDPANIHYDIEPARLSWMLVRKQRTAEVLSRDEHKCRYCGSLEKLEIDHIKPLARGGTNELNNLQILCGPCNRKKWAHMP